LPDQSAEAIRDANDFGAAASQESGVRFDTIAYPRQSAFRRLRDDMRRERKNWRSAPQKWLADPSTPLARSNASHTNAAPDSHLFLRPSSTIDHWPPSPSLCISCLAPGHYLSTPLGILVSTLPSLLPCHSAKDSEDQESSNIVNTLVDTNLSVLLPQVYAPQALLLLTIWLRTLRYVFMLYACPHSYNIMRTAPNTPWCTFTVSRSCSLS
jgi:hypothetical protein